MNPIVFSNSNWPCSMHVCFGQVQSIWPSTMMPEGGVENLYSKPANGSPQTGHGSQKYPPTHARNFASILGLSISFLLSGCNGTLPPAPIVTLLPVPVPCLTREQIPPKDFLRDTELAKLDDFALVIGLRTEQLKQRGWIETVDALIQACVK